MYYKTTRLIVFVLTIINNYTLYIRFYLYLGKFLHKTLKLKKLFYHFSVVKTY